MSRDDRLVPIKKLLADKCFPVLRRLITTPAVDSGFIMNILRNLQIDAGTMSVDSLVIHQAFYSALKNICELLEQLYTAELTQHPKVKDAN